MIISTIIRKILEDIIILVVIMLVMMIIVVLIIPELSGGLGLSDSELQMGRKGIKQL